MNNRQGKLIVIEAGDGSGKATQTKKLFERLNDEGRRVKQISFPNYKSPSSSLVKMYLKGDFGKHADDVDAYAAASFYAVDRYASYKMDWKSAYDNGEIILADRYTTSNMVHQAVKIKDKTARNKFLDWVDDFEYVKLKLPRPNLIIFLDMPADISIRLIEERNHLIDISDKNFNDIHEKDFDYLKRCYTTYKEIAQQFGWHVINCITNNDVIRSIENINEEVWTTVNNIL